MQPVGTFGYKVGRLLVLIALLSAILAAPAGADPKFDSDPENAVIGATYGHGRDGPGSYAVLIDVHEIQMDRGKPAAKPNCSPDDTSALSGGYVYTGWKITNVLPVAVNTSTVPSSLGDVLGIMQASWNAWRADPAVPQVAVTDQTSVTKYTANGTDDILFGRTGSSLATTYTWRWNDGVTYESDTVFNKSVAWANIVDDGDGCNQLGPAVYDVANIATHEFGHSYGMDHPPGRFETMYAYGYSGETLKRSPDLGDIEGISALYP